MRGDGISKGKSGVNGAVEGGSSTTGCGRQCSHGTKARLAHKHAVNQKISERNTTRVETNSNPNGSATLPANNATNKSSSNIKKNTKQKSVDDVVKYIEGNPSDKKKIKKERQKQERQEALKKQEEEQKRVQEAKAREQQRIEEEEKRRAAEAARNEPPMSKKQLKKANQKAKRIAEQTMPSSPSQPAYSQIPTTRVGNAPGLNSLNSMEQLKAKQQREMEMMEMRHRHALEEEQMRGMYGQKGQPSMKQQYSSPQYQPQSMSPSLGGIGSSLGGIGSGLGGLGSSGRSAASPLSSLEDLKAQLNNLTSNTMNQLRSGLMKPSLTDNMDGLQSNQQMKPPATAPQSMQPKKNKNKVNSNPIGNVGTDKAKQGGNRSNLPEAAQKALVSAGSNPGNQIRISRNAQGGVDFTPIPASEGKQG